MYLNINRWVGVAILSMLELRNAKHLCRRWLLRAAEACFVCALTIHHLHCSVSKRCFSSVRLMYRALKPIKWIWMWFRKQNERFVHSMLPVSEIQLWRSRTKHLGRNDGFDSYSPVRFSLDLEPTNVMWNRIVKFICCTVSAVGRKWSRQWKRNVWSATLIKWVEERKNRGRSLHALPQCLICSKSPVGDYYQYRNEILCASCFNFNWQFQEKFKRT